jgi:hypothetical protein
MKKEKWIDDIIQSGKNIQPVEANPYLATRVQAKLNALAEKGRSPQIPIRWVYASAFAMMVLLIINVVLWSHSAPSPKNAGIQQVMQEYGWGGNNDLYTMNFSK